MGHSTVLHGYIRNWLGHEEDNLRQLAALPETDDLPIPLTPNMFAPASSGYNAQLLPFGRQYNGVEQHWQAWRTKFEDLLRMLYWNEVHVYLETEFWGAYHFWWEREWSEAFNDPDTPEDAVRQELDQPTRTWTYYGPNQHLFHYILGAETPAFRPGEEAPLLSCCPSCCSSCGWCEGPTRSEKPSA